MIPPFLTEFFPLDVRHLGDETVAAGRVRIAQAAADSLIALVTGSMAYAVDIHAAEGQVVMGCTCAFAEEHGGCKHIWAALSQAAAEDRLAPLLEAAGPWALAYALPGANEPDDLSSEVEPAGPSRDAAGDAHEDWRRRLDEARRELGARPPRERTAAWPANRRLIYVIDAAATWPTSGVVIELATETLRRDGSWSAPSPFTLGGDVWFAAPSAVDRQIAQMLAGAQGTTSARFVVHEHAFDTTLRQICDSGRARLRARPGERPTAAVRWDDGPPWHPVLEVEAQPEAGRNRLRGYLVRHDERMPVEQPALLHAGGLLIADDRAAQVEYGASWPVIAMLRAGPVEVTDDEMPEMLERLYALPHLPRVTLGENAGVRERCAPPVPWLTIVADQSGWRGGTSILSLGFRYGSVRVGAEEGRTAIFDPRGPTVHHRDARAEAAARARLRELGAREEWDHGAGVPRLTVPQSALMPLVMALATDGWRVDSEGVLYRAPTETHAEVRSGVDWFDLHAGVRFGEFEVPLDELMAARRRGRDSVTLADGSEGLLPAEWLARFDALVAAAGDGDQGVTRFGKSQAALLDALLESLPPVEIDTAFARARAELRSFEGIEPMDPPAGFRGVLREYQREGLGWLHFLNRFHLGGCLADDMGLGKTIQVLALLESRRETAAGPSLVVMPRSLVHNWIREAERFTPGLRLLDNTGAERQATELDLTGVDVLLATYGTLRRDAASLAAIEFDYVILDEAQAIKNAGTASAKAARLLRAQHRLAVTGTPIENRLEELWSLFEFLNPGMLGARSSIARLAADENDLLGRALRPVILRRTKETVATELPPRTEQTLEVELEPAQRQFYDALLAQYRASLLARVDRDGMGRSRMHVLEALLRLRQAACHPVLADESQRELPSAKLDALIPTLEEIAAEGHKALVFSQFTSFLTLVRERLDAVGLRYEYLDGSTRDRQGPVDRFQGEDGPPLFLISLKAGGQGLNLTAADYVFILDPWWNPAVEAQAIDRTHRIGQTRPVIATRLVAAGTVEEKILELQASKRTLAEAILSADQGALGRIGRAELEELLS